MIPAASAIMIAACFAPGPPSGSVKCAEAHRQQETRLHLFGDGQVNQQAADDPHDHHLPCEIAEVGEQPGEGLQKLHV